MPASDYKVYLIVDASILRAAGELSKVPLSIHCYEFLKTILNTNYLVVQTPKIREEWSKHASRYSQTWRTEMTNRRRIKFLKEEEVINKELRDKIAQTQFSPPERQANALAAMQKDVHLAEAALATDKIVTALDDTVRKFFAQVCSEIAELQEITWVNPEKVEEEKPIEWLKAGAKLDKTRWLLNYKWQEK